MLRNILIVCLSLTGLAFSKDCSAQDIEKYFESIEFSYTNITGIGHEPGCTRRDPSDVIKVGDTWYVYYTKIYGRSPGYWGSVWYATSTDEGYNWEEKGEFENNSTTDITAIGVAVSTSPDGLFNRINDGQPILKVSVEPEKFDSYRVDDAVLLYRNGLYWLYYKGRSRVPV
jgi:hypothetical protein